MQRWNNHVRIKLQQRILRWSPGWKAIALIYIISMAIVLYITGFELKLLRTELLVKEIKLDGINYDAFRSFTITKDLIDQSNLRIQQITKKNPIYQNKPFIDAVGYLTFSMMASDYEPGEAKLPDAAAFLRGIGKVAGSESFQELYEYYRIVLSDIKYFPVPRVESKYKDVAYSDTWYVLRRYGGNRRHEGCDLMDPNQIRGFFPIVSMTDGIVENMGWLEQGGYRVGIRSKSGGYFYYAHLSTYAPNLAQGDEVIAGQLLGFMGDSGYGKEGTIGQFDIHLHLGIYVPSDTGDMSINPYWLLKLLENKRTSYSYSK